MTTRWQAPNAMRLQSQVSPTSTLHAQPCMSQTTHIISRLLAGIIISSTPKYFYQCAALCILLPSNCFIQNPFPCRQSWLSAVFLASASSRWMSDGSPNLKVRICHCHLPISLLLGINLNLRQFALRFRTCLMKWNALSFHSVDQYTSWL